MYDLSIILTIRLLGMEELETNVTSPEHNNPYIPLFLAAINTQTDLIVLLHHHTPIFLNDAFLKFSNVKSVKEFLREFGSLLNRFVYHDDYFHAGKVANLDKWSNSLAEIPEEDRIVSMVSHKFEPHAFLVKVNSPIPDYTILTFKDISLELIQRIMIENDASIDHSSGAYDRDYFLHTSKMFHEAAIYNKKLIAISMIELVDNIDELSDFVTLIKKQIRQSDMLVRWGQKKFLLAYFIRLPEVVSTITQKLRQTSNYTIRINSSIQNENESIEDIIVRAETDNL